MTPRALTYQDINPEMPIIHEILKQGIDTVLMASRVVKYTKVSFAVRNIPGALKK